MLRFIKSCAAVGEPHKGFGAGPVAASSGQTALHPLIGDPADMNDLLDGQCHGPVTKH